MDRAKATETELLDASRRGERTAFGELVERCARMVSAVAYAATRDRVLSEDIAQDTFVAAWSQLDRLREETALRPWLCGIARNLAHKARRARSRELPVAAPDAYAAEAPLDGACDGQVEHVVAAALARVPDVYREALVLFYYEQRSARDVAVALGVTENVVHKRLSRGRRYLAAGVEQIVETDLERQRSRRDLAAYVLAALPSTPLRATAASGLTRMWRLGALATAAATITVGTAAAWPRSTADARTDRVALVRPQPVASATTTPATHAGPSPQLPAPVQPPAVPAPAHAPARIGAGATGEAVTCALAAQHLVAVLLAGYQAVDDRGSKVQRVAERLEKKCRDDQWTQSDLECILASDEVADVKACIPEEPASTQLAPPERPSGEADLACAVVGKHVADLMIASMSGLRQDNVAASVLVDTDGLSARIQAACANEPWPEPARRCFAGATRFEQIVLCKRQSR